MQTFEPLLGLDLGNVKRSEDVKRSEAWSENYRTGQSSALPGAGVKRLWGA
jgi:hypothetical protein